MREVSVHCGTQLQSQHPRNSPTQSFGLKLSIRDASLQDYSSQNTLNCCITACSCQNSTTASLSPKGAWQATMWRPFLIHTSPTVTQSHSHQSSETEHLNKACIFPPERSQKVNFAQELTTKYFGVWTYFWSSWTFAFESPWKMTAVYLCLGSAWFQP